MIATTVTPEIQAGRRHTNRLLSLFYHRLTDQWTGVLERRADDDRTWLITRRYTFAQFPSGIVGQFVKRTGSDLDIYVV